MKLIITTIPGGKPITVEQRDVDPGDVTGIIYELARYSNDYQTYPDEHIIEIFNQNGHIRVQWEDTVSTVQLCKWQRTHGDWNTAMNLLFTHEDPLDLLPAPQDGHAHMAVLSSNLENLSIDIKIAENVPVEEMRDVVNIVACGETVEECGGMVRIGLPDSRCDTLQYVTWRGVDKLPTKTIKQAVKPAAKKRPKKPVPVEDESPVEILAETLSD